MQYIPPLGSVDPNASYVNGNPADGSRGSYPNARGFEVVQREIVGVIAATGQSPNDGDLGQLWKGVDRITNATRIIYIDAALGSDANDGLTTGTAVASFAAAMALVRAGQNVSVFLRSDITIAGVFLNAAATIHVQSSGGTRTVTFASAGLVNNPGAQGANIISNAAVNLIFLDVNIAVANIPSTISGVTIEACFILAMGSNLFFSNNTFTRNAGSSVPLVSAFQSANVEFISASFSGTWGGYIFKGVTSGNNPNSLWNYHSNLTAA